MVTGRNEHQAEELDLCLARRKDPEKWSSKGHALVRSISWWPLPGRTGQTGELEAGPQYCRNSVMVYKEHLLEHKDRAQRIHG